MILSRRNTAFFRLTAFCAALFLAGCVSVPIDALRLPPDYLARRSLQSRAYETTDETKIIQSCAAVLQDMGFTLDESETQLGVILASKDRSAVNSGEVVAALALDFLAAASGSYSNNYAQTDKAQKIRASAVTKRSEDGSKVLVRAVFQRMVWNQAGNLSRLETLRDAEMYQGFYEKLSKAVFLEEQKI